LIGRVDGEDPSVSTLGPKLVAAGFTPTSKGYFKRAVACDPRVR